MCDIYEDESTFAWRQEWRRARVVHKCYACRETIAPGHRYSRTSQVTAGEGWRAYVHCARCWLMIEHLWRVRMGDPVAWDLDCGEPYEPGPDDPGHALAFMTPAEAQERAPWKETP